MRKKYVLILIILLFPSLLFSENNLIILLNNGKTVNAELREITDKTLILVREVIDEDDDTTIVLKNNIKKVIAPDSSNDFFANIEIHLQDSVIEDKILTGIDMEKYLMFYSQYQYPDDEDMKTDTLNLSDTNIKMIIVYGQSNVVGGIFAGTGIGLIGGAIGRGLLATAFSLESLVVLAGIVGGGIFGMASGLLVGTIIGIAGSADDMEIDNTKMLKYELLNYIVYPDVIYEPDELE